MDGTMFCTTLEGRGVKIPALWYTVSVIRSPRFKRLLPIVNHVPCSDTPHSPRKRTEERSGIRFHVGTRPEHSAGCILVPNREIESRLTQTLL